MQLLSSWQIYLAQKKFLDSPYVTIFAQSFNWQHACQNQQAHVILIHCFKLLNFHNNIAKLLTVILYCGVLNSNNVMIMLG